MSFHAKDLALSVVDKKSYFSMNIEIKNTTLEDSNKFKQSFLKIPKHIEF